MVLICDVVVAVAHGFLRELKKIRRLLQRKRHIKTELCVSLSVSRLFRGGHVVQSRRSALLLASRE